MAKQSESRPLPLSSGIPVKPVYTPEDTKDLDYHQDLGDPGQYPFTRGIHPLMYRARPWTMRQYAGFGTARETNERFKYLIAHGQNALNVAFDLPTQLGLDSDDPLAYGEVGRVGMAVDTLNDMEEAFQGIPLDAISSSLTINAPAAVFIAMYAVVAEKQGVPLDKVAGTPQNDILKEYIGRGAWVFPAKPSLRLIGDTIEYCTRHMPRYNPVSVCGYHIRESGANPAQEMAYAFAIALTYLQLGVDRGLPIDSFAGRISFNFNVFGKLFEEVAKFRAGRRLWARLVKQRFGAKEPRSMWMRMLAGGGGRGLTKEEPENNIVRGAYYALAGVLGGCQTMALCCYDEAYTIPTAKAQLISLRTMQILADEVGLTDTVDPLAGSYFIEALTDQMEKKILEYMDEVDKAGGIVSAIETGVIQRQLARQAYEEEKRIISGELIKIGVNKYRQSAEEPKVELHPHSMENESYQVARLRKVKAERDEAKVEKALAQLRQAAQGEENLMPTIMDAVRVYASLGEITRVLKEVFGEFNEPTEL